MILDGRQREFDESGHGDDEREDDSDNEDEVRQT